MTWESFEEKYRNTGGFLFEDSLSIPGDTICDWYFDPIEEVQILYSEKEKLSETIKTSLSKLDDYRNQGFYPCGALFFELGYFFIEGLALSSAELAEGTPLLQYTIYKQKKRIQYTNPNFHQTDNIHSQKLDILWTKDTYKERWEKTKEALLLGESYELNLCFPVSLSVEEDLFLYYQSLKSKQKTKYSAYYPFGDTKTLSFSPELFFEVTGDKIQTEPMKGTILRGTTSKQDETNKLILQSSAKERAENVMITDLYRNDLGRIAKQGTVQVTELFLVKGLETVWQMVSKVEAKLKNPFEWFPILQALFPSGSVIGAPKKRSFELLREIEKNDRGLYTGALFVSEMLDGKPWIRSSVTIRTIYLKKEGNRWIGNYGVGSGITVLSDVDAEYEECLSKLKFITNPNLPPFEILETIRLHQGRYFLKNLHLERMEQTANRFGYPFSKQNAETTLKVMANQTNGNFRIRFLLNERGEFNIESFVFTKPKTRPTIRLGFANKPVDSKNLFLYHKTTNRNFYNEMMEECKKKSWDDCILFDIHDQILETNIRNLFVRKGKIWFTPRLETGGLPGVFREALVRKRWVKETILFKSDLETADEILVGNSLRGFERVEFVTST
ncbi:bifunctional aminodeoxychorismate synthase component I/aminotransferase [Leptospira congkakensis]|uniref:Bifunctional aminodeoxychorismate synthase component I/aminotransferase n=2 Tax=Leptospira congkakensis TaxID=2484932 RepID=A0A4Z1A4T4_9LEPT|nr:bifunctional anthranilate synthase component I family protein/class IV aminotransferase [Leptospira congkakensis]TGL87414.1 bifunctional aminodeoxychorismate synthase component I/aminotransferase [Leptospira congkakensis]TGL96975.1 bifunctional aminodeoxychorismate synthase component I/aminotransferase [Leptospira congkakensis]TGL97717.1 bifunctional aminodeoxychorismate synthase component I/aminotransferase [Leptospira congkakensis]